MILQLTEIIECEHDYKSCRDSLGGVSFEVCYKCGWTKKSINTVEMLIIDLKESVSLLELYDKIKEDKEEKEK